MIFSAKMPNYLTAYSERGKGALQTRWQFIVADSNSFLEFLGNSSTLRKHAYSNILKILPPTENENFQIKFFDIFHISAKNIDCGYSVEPPRRGGSNEYPQSMF